MSLEKSASLRADSAFIARVLSASDAWAIKQLIVWRTGQPSDRKKLLMRITFAISMALIQRELKIDVVSMLAAHPAIIAQESVSDETLTAAVTAYASAMCTSLEFAGEQYARTIVAVPDLSFVG